MTEEFEGYGTGDVVFLKSNVMGMSGRLEMIIPMTVRYIVDKQAAKDIGLTVGVYCNWLDVFGKPREACYLPEQLTRTIKVPKPDSVIRTDES